MFHFTITGYYILPINVLVKILSYLKVSVRVNILKFVLEQFCSLFLEKNILYLLNWL